MYIYVLISEMWNNFSRHFRLWIWWYQWHDCCDTAWEVT